MAAIGSYGYSEYCYGLQRVRTSRFGPSRSVTLHRSNRTRLIGRADYAESVNPLRLHRRRPLGSDSHCGRAHGSHGRGRPTARMDRSVGAHPPELLERVLRVRADGIVPRALGAFRQKLQPDAE